MVEWVPEGISPPAWGGVWGKGCAPSTEKFSILKMKMACFDALWNTVLKFMCLQQ